MRCAGRECCGDIRAVAFDVNGTLIRILTEDGADQVFRAAAHFLTYQGIDLPDGADPRPLRSPRGDLGFQWPGTHDDQAQPPAA